MMFEEDVSAAFSAAGSSTIGGKPAKVHRVGYAECGAGGCYRLVKGRELTRLAAARDQQNPLAVTAERHTSQ